MKTKEEFIESLRRQKPTVYMYGEKIDNCVDHPAFKPCLNCAASTYELANDPRYQELLTDYSPLIEDNVNAWVQIERTPEEVLKRHRFLRLVIPLRQCTFRCMSIATLQPLWAATYETDQEHGTEYHQRLAEFVKYVQRNDLQVTGALTDVKGDRRLRPHQQPDPDMYVRVVERRTDGIIVNGAKISISGATCVNEIIFLPTRAMTKEDKDYAVAFAIPPDTKGLILITRPTSAPRVTDEMQSPVSSKYGLTESFIILDHVFIPRDRVFLCGEWEVPARIIDLNTSIERQLVCGCGAGKLDFRAGAAALMAECNNVEEASHVRQKFSEIIVAAELMNALGIASAVEGCFHPSGVWISNPLPAQAAKMLAGYKFAEINQMLMEIAGGPVVTMPTLDDYRNPEIKRYFNKYLKTSDDIPTEKRLRAFELINDITASRFAGWQLAEVLLGGGSPEASRVIMMRNYDLEAKKGFAKLACGIE